MDGGTFFSIGDVRTRGYTEIVADVFSYITGSVDFRVGPLDDFIFSRPVEHNHYILSSEPDTIVDNEREGVPVEIPQTIHELGKHQHLNQQVAVFVLGHHMDSQEKH